jgi:hypothetical protein
MRFYLQPDHESIATHIFFEVHDDGRISIFDDLPEGGPTWGCREIDVQQDAPNLTSLTIKTLLETGCFGIHDIIEPIAAQRHTFTEKNDLFVGNMHYIEILLIVQVIYSASYA